MPSEYFVILAFCVAVMGLSAWYLGDEDKRIRALSRLGLVLGGTGLLVATFYYSTILLAVLIVALPLLLVAAWWNGLW